MKEYIIKVNEEKKDIMGNYYLVEPPKELIRCKDCRYYDFGLCDNVPTNTMPRPREEEFYCADAKQRERKQE